MPAITDFRKGVFGVSRVDASGKDVGRRVYWKLYAIENLLRVVTHSVLNAQVGAHWWSVAVSPETQKKTAKFRTQYQRRPWHTSPGVHDIYYTHLSDLGEIIRANSHLFAPVLPDIGDWVARIEQIRLPRNVVGHMNWPSKVDRQRVDVVYEDLRALVVHLEASGLQMSVP